MSRMTLEMAANYARKRFELYPCADETQIKIFEETYGVELPEEYRTFILTIGNGGTQWVRPFFELGEAGERQSALQYLSQPFPYSSHWNQSQAEDYYKPHHIQGTLPFFHEGSGMYHLLVVTGAECGNVWLDARVNDSGIGPLPYQANAPRITFFEWFKWLDELFDQTG